MKNHTQDTLHQLQAMIESDTENREIPARLQPDAIVELLEHESERGGNADPIPLPKPAGATQRRRMLAVAAMLALALTGSIFLLQHRSTRELPRAEAGSYDLVKNAESYEEISRAVQEILKKQTEPQPANPTAAASAGNNNPGKTGDTTRAAADGDAPQAVSDLLEAGLQLMQGFVAVPLPETAAPQAADSAAATANADFVKAHGDYLYLVTTQRNAETGAAQEQIRIVQTGSGGMRVAATVTLTDGTAASCFDLSLSGDRLIALLHQPEGANGTATQAIIFDVRNPAAPKKLCTLVQDGVCVDAAVRGGKLRLITNHSFANSYGTGLNAYQAGALPALTVNGAAVRPKAEDVCLSINDPEPSYLFITDTALADPTETPSMLTILGCGSGVTAAEDTIYVTRRFASVEADGQSPQRQRTAIYRFGLRGGELQFSGAFLAEGTLLGGVEPRADGALCAVIASETGDTLYCLNDAMEILGKAEASGTHARQAQYLNDRCYLVGEARTAVIDLRDPAAPKATTIGAVPALARTLFRINAQTLAALQTNADGSAQLTPVDLTDPAAPQTGTPYTLAGDLRMAANEDGRSVTLIREKAMIGLPVIFRSAAGKDVPGYLLFRAGNGEVQPVGAFRHAGDAAGAAVHGACIGNVFYTVSADTICAFSLEDGAALGSLKF